MNITSAKYIANELGENNTVQATIDGNEWFVPMTLTNPHYAEIMRQVEAGTLTIQDAD